MTNAGREYHGQADPGPSECALPSGRASTLNKHTPRWWIPTEPLPSDMAESDSVIPDRIGVVIGWRVWGLGEDERLYSLQPDYGQVAWVPGAIGLAACAVSEHEAPDPKCNCGFHAADTAARALRFGTYHLPNRKRLVLGEVAMWGRVQEHESGWRAQKARPYRLYFGSEISHQTAQRVAENYQITTGDRTRYDQMWRKMREQEMLERVRAGIMSALVFFVLGSGLYAGGLSGAGVTAVMALLVSWFIQLIGLGWLYAVVSVTKLRKSARVGLIVGLPLLAVLNLWIVKIVIASQIV